LRKELKTVGFIQRLGLKTIGMVNGLGGITLFFIKALLMIFRPRQFRQIIEQVFYIGAKSSVIVAMVALFTGMVLGLQLFYALSKYGSEGTLGSSIGLSLIRELGPVLTAIMVTARAGSAMAAEIGIMRISEQIDALDTMRIDPVRYLVSPRIAASVISFPLLTALFDVVGLIGGYFSGVMLLGVNEGAYVYRIQTSVETSDITGGFIKAVVFALLVSLICCYNGFFTHLRGSRGARGVSISTTSAVVMSCVMILASDYIVTSFLM
jgi:phospholipid/cholesterol/gamma-HCH transport system permease protein